MLTFLRQECHGLASGPAQWNVVSLGGTQRLFPAQAGNLVPSMNSVPWKTLTDCGGTPFGVSSTVDSFCPPNSSLQSHEIMDAISFFIQHELAKLDSAASLAIQQVQQAKNIRQLIAAKHVSIRAELRCLQHLAPALRQLEQAAGRRAKEIVDQQLKTLANISDKEAFKAQRVIFVQDWVCLSGHFPQLASTAKRQSDLLWRAHQAED